MNNQVNPALAALWGGYQSDEDKSLSAGTGSSIKLGLNPNCTIKTFAYSTKTGQNNTEGNPAICITFDINGQDVNTRIYAPGQKVYFKGKEITDVNSPDYLEGLKQQVALTKGMVTHYLKGMGIPEEQIKANLANVAGFEQLAQLACQAASQFIPTAKIDVFAHYQATIKNGADKTYLEIPTDLAYGSFLTPSTPNAEWTEKDSFNIETPEGVVVKKGLAYVNAQGVQHRFVRDEAFLKSKRASQQTKGGATTGTTTGQGGSASPFANNAAQPAQNTTPAQGNVTGWGA